MYPLCRHIKTNGLQCKSPALRRGQFCYFHTNSHTVSDQVKFGPLVLPTPEDPGAILISVARINEAVLTGRIELRKASVLLAGLRLAAQFIDGKQYFDFERTVQIVENDMRGDEIAPRNFVCDEDEDDCNNCPYSNQCSRSSHQDEDDEDHEEDNEGEMESDQEEEEQQLPIVHAVVGPTQELRVPHPCDVLCRKGGKPQCSIRKQDVAVGWGTAKPNLISSDH